ncbi:MULTISPECIES: DUF6600 domain-containing protein [unclassified Roseateles]|uniref:DUF6600 domain-containing protein n=1 Tax=unclassified Roseateles TaxID=2626991 RepID=UPI0006F50097|nr:MULTISPECIES: DUF6600 domain-containing protein [unclassified Roseateles]KQW52143.1 hypothetical protein ASC81_05995 [Pelomonas sp. Root405]KRA78377.1 hypothetical protein ASD88_06000 [Pelomonas sp. Root662]
MATLADSKLVLIRSRWRILAMTLLLALAPAAKAEDADRDPPSRAARVVEVVGDAWLFDPDTREWTRLTRNQTVGEGDRLRTDERARISLRTGSTTIWVDERSDLELSQLDDGRTLLQLDRGDVALRLRSPENAAETQLRTREGLAQPEREGLYRVEQLDRGSKVYVWQGRMRFDWTRSASPVHLGAGEQIELWWPDGPRAERSPLYSDGFGDWVLAESREEGDRAVARYVSPEMTGAEDLDRYGRWETAPEYGTVWIPTTVVAADWAPYRHGRWAWSRHWGWTWVDDAPWGFAPFHYGRWVSWGGRWCWAPGPYVHRPVYAPALVGWVGGGSVSVGISIGHRPPPPRYGWYPLAPREVYRPGFRHSPRYVHRVNDPRDLRDPVTVQRPHRYRDVPQAVSTLPAPGAAIQPMPVRGPDRRPEPGWNRPLPTAPGRGDLAAVLPAAPTRPVEAGLPRQRDREREPGMGWRSESQLPLRREVQRGPDAPNPQPAMPVAQPQQPQIQSPVPTVQQPRPAFESPRGGGDNMPWRNNPQQREERRDERREERREEPRRVMPQPMPQAEQPRSMPMPERPQVVEQPRRVEMPMRQPEPPRMQMPQPQPQPQVQAPPRSEGPQRGRQDGVPVRDKSPRERQQER